METKLNKAVAEQKLEESLKEQAFNSLDNNKYVITFLTFDRSEIPSSIPSECVHSIEDKIDVNYQDCDRRRFTIKKTIYFTAAKRDSLKKHPDAIIDHGDYALLKRMAANKHDKYELYQLDPNPFTDFWFTNIMWLFKAGDLLILAIFASLFFLNASNLISALLILLGAIAFIIKEVFEINYWLKNAKYYANLTINIISIFSSAPMFLTSIYLIGFSFHNFVELFNGNDISGVINGFDTTFVFIAAAILLDVLSLFIGQLVRSLFSYQLDDEYSGLAILSANREIKRVWKEDKKFALKELEDNKEKYKQIVADFISMHLEQ